MDQPSDFKEDEEILAQLDDEADVEAFSNLMAHAHDLGISAADFVREEPKRTSRKRIRKLCLKDQKRTFKMIVRSVIQSLWDRPANESAENYVHTLYGPPKKPGQTHLNGHHRKANGE